MCDEAVLRGVSKQLSGGCDAVALTSGFVGHSLRPWNMDAQVGTLEWSVAVPPRAISMRVSVEVAAGSVGASRLP